MVCFALAVLLWLFLHSGPTQKIRSGGAVQPPRPPDDKLNAYLYSSDGVLNRGT